jgi:hypothetical protein
VSQEINFLADGATQPENCQSMRSSSPVGPMAMRPLLLLTCHSEQQPRSQIQALSLTQLESLGEALLDFTGAEDLDRWLRSVSTHGA